MNCIQVVGIIITAIAVPYVVALIKSEAITGNRARWLAIGISIAAGIVTALASGIPATPMDVIVCVITAIGAVQLAYSAFKSVGVTCKWLDALSAISKDSDDPLVLKKNQALKDKAEEAADRRAEDE